MASVTFCSAADLETENQQRRGRNNSSQKQNRINPVEEQKQLKQQQKAEREALRDKKLAEEKIEEEKRLALAAERQAKEKQRFDEECAKRSAEHLEQQVQADREKAEHLKEKQKMKQERLIAEAEERRIRAESEEEARRIAERKAAEKKENDRKEKEELNKRTEELMTSMQLKGITPLARFNLPSGASEELQLSNATKLLTLKLEDANDGFLSFNQEGFYFKDIDASILLNMTDRYDALKQNPLLVRTNVTMMTTNTCKYQHIQNNDSFHLISSSEPLTIKNTIIESESISILSEHITCDAFFITNQPITLAFPGNSLSQFRYVKLYPLPITAERPMIYIRADIAYSPYIQSSNTISYTGIATIEFLRRF